jgi:hypothetical protein
VADLHTEWYRRYNKDWNDNLTVEGLQERLQDISVYAKLIQLLEIEQQLEHHEQEKGQ